MLNIIIVCYVLSMIGNWIKYDDDDVSLVTEEEILKLSGGGMLLSLFYNVHVFSSFITGDWHTAYILLYAPKRLEIVEED